MEPVKIIVFQGKYNTYIHSKKPLNIMYFSCADIDPDNLIELSGRDWSFDGIGTQDDVDNFDEIWETGNEFYKDPKRLKKLRKLKELEELIDKQEEDLKNLKKKYLDLNT